MDDVLTFPQDDGGVQHFYVGNHTRNLIPDVDLMGSFKEHGPAKVH
jgi:hypothetical protein